MRDFLLGLFISTLILSGCQDRHNVGHNMVSVRMSGDSMIETVDAFRFEDGTLVEVIYDLSPRQDGTYMLDAEDFTGTVYFVVNAGKVTGFRELLPGSSIEDFLSLTATQEQMTGDTFLMTGSAVLQRWQSQIDIILKRSVARIDIETSDAGVEVLDVRLRNVAERGPAVAGGTPGIFSEGNDIVCDYSSAPLSGGNYLFGYLCDQTNGILYVEANVRFGGGIHRLYSRLPENIRSNTVYTVKVFGKGGNVSIGIVSQGWESSEPSQTETAGATLIDVDKSELSKGLSVGEGRDTLYISHSRSEGRVVLSNADQYEVSVSGNVDGAQVSVSDSIIDIVSPRRGPGSSREYVYVDAYQQGIHKGRVVLCFLEHPVYISGILDFDNNFMCDFGRYVDGELGIFHLPEGVTASLSIDGDQWAILQETESGCRLLAGWKPNDPNADGRIQEAVLTISGEGFAEPENFIIRRRNWGLPVVKMGDLWWCKYNLRGNSRSFEDQILISEDPVADSDLQSYMLNCPEDELLAILGDQYQAGNTTGLPLKFDGSLYYYDGMKPSVPSWGTISADEMVPDGYSLPDYSQFAFFSWNNDSNYGGVGTRPFNNKYGNRLNVSVVERDVDFLGSDFGVISTYSLEYEENTWVMCGLGHQWNTDHGSISRMNIIFATFGQQNNTWNMEGYASNEKPGQNWFKFVAHNSTKTRTIRCIKKPVEYIYE